MLHDDAVDAVEDWINPAWTGARIQVTDINDVFNRDTSVGELQVEARDYMLGGWGWTCQTWCGGSDAQWASSYGTIW